MIYSIIKKWVIIAFYLFIFALIDGFYLDTLLLPIPELFNQIHVYLLLLSLCTSLFLHFWEMALPVLNNYYKILLILFGVIALLSFQVLSPQYMLVFHIFLLLGVLSYQLIIYHSYNKPFVKESKKTKKVKYVWILLAGVLIYGMYSYSNKNVVLKYQEAYPTRQELNDDLQWDCVHLDLQVNYSTNRRADNINACYSLKHSSFHYIDSSLMVKGYSKSCYQYEGYQLIQNGDMDNFTLYEKYDDIAIYQNNYKSYSEYYGKNTSSVVTIYEDEQVVVYTRFDIVYDEEINYDELLNEINEFHDYFRSFKY